MLDENVQINKTIEAPIESRKERHERKSIFKKQYAKKFTVPNFISSDYNNSSSIDLYTITFNNPKIIDYQIKLIKKNLIGNYTHIVCDNSNIQEAAEKIREICEKNNITYYRVSISSPSGYSDAHGRALNWVYYNIIRERKNNFAFIDHDIFPIKSFNVEDYLKENNLYGVIRTARKIWFLWPAFSFFNYEFLKNKKLNFRKYKFWNIFHYHGADSGSGLWTSVYKNYNKNSIPQVSCQHVDIINNCEPDWTKLPTGYESYIQTNLVQYIDDSRWFHSICGGEWRANVTQKNEIVYKLLDNFLTEAQEFNHN